MSEAVAEAIKQRVNAEIGQLPSHLRKWAKRHVVLPRIVTALAHPDRPQTVDVWLVTDDNGTNDGSDRIVFHPNAGSFGRLTTLADGRLWYQGPQEGGFADAVESL